MPQKHSEQIQQHEPFHGAQGQQQSSAKSAQPMVQRLQPRMVIPLPPGQNGSCITRDPRFGRAPGVYPIHVLGTYVLPPGVTLTGAEPINLCYIPHGAILTDFKIVTAGITGTLQDSLPTPTEYGTVADDLFTMADMTPAQAQNLGTMYFSTPRALGTDGPQVVQWQQGITLQIAAAAGTPTTPMIYLVQWSPVYDGGV